MKDEQPFQADLDHFKNILSKLSPMARAVYDGDQAQLEELVRLGCGFDEVRKNLPSPLTVAITLRRRRMITYLLDAGADPNVHNGALLGFVASRRELDLLRLLLDRGANVGSKIRGKTALCWAVELGHLEAVDLLLERGAPLEEDEGEGFTPLLIAANKAARAGGCSARRCGSERQRSDERTQVGNLPSSWQRAHRDRSSSRGRRRKARVRRGKLDAIDRGVRRGPRRGSVGAAPAWG